jgi:precorrin-2/cobalt-factor-2 C20-methyltransferase
MARGETMTGTLHLVGVGPGDPDLMTIKAAKLLDEAEVIAHVVTPSGGTLALDIARRHCNPHAEYLPIEIPMTGDRRATQIAYDAGADAIRAQLAAGRDVAYLCEGDPLFYGSAMYLLSDLIDTTPIKVIPGVTSMTAAAAAIPFPLVARSDSLTVLAGTSPDEVLFPKIDAAGSVVILKVGRHYDRLCALLDRTGRADSSWLAENVGTPQQRLVRVRDAEPGPKPYFSLLLCFSGAEFWLE